MIKETERIYVIDLALFLPFLKIDMDADTAAEALGERWSCGMEVTESTVNEDEQSVTVTVTFDDDFTDCKPSDVLEQVRLWLTEWLD
jgi:hypothetical protein